MLKFCTIVCVMTDNVAFLREHCFKKYVGHWNSTRYGKTWRAQVWILLRGTRHIEYPHENIVKRKQRSI